MNVVNLMGRLGADPEIRHTSGGDQVANFPLATSSYSKGKEYTEWHRVVCFGKTAEIVGEYLAKGSGLGVEGRLQTRKWQDKEGHDRYTTEVVANRIHFAGKKADRQEERQSEPKQEATPDFDDDIPF